MASTSNVMRFTNSAMIRIALRSKRSAITPPKTDSTSEGTCEAAATAVTWNGDAVMSKTSQPRAMMSIKNDVIESSEPTQ